MNTLCRFGEISRALRSARGMTIADQAKALGEKPSMISKLEIGVAKPSLSYIKRFCDWVHADFVSHQEMIRASFDPLREGIAQDHEHSKLYRKMNKMTAGEIRRLATKIQDKQDAR